MDDIPEIDPELFIYELYDASGLQFLEGWELAKFAIGYCDAGRLQVRPKPGELALMCEMQGDKLWFHINKRILDNINRRRKRGLP